MKVNGPRLLIRRIDDAGLKSKLIEVIQYEHSPSQFALVIAVGNGQRLPNGERQPIPVEAGQVVITKPFIGQEVEYAGETCHMVMEEDVLAICEGL